MASSPSSAGPIAYLNTRRIPADQLVVAATDAGFLFGVTLAEQMRTFGGRLFEPDRHLDRLLRGLERMDWVSGVDRVELLREAEDVVHEHLPLLPADSDLGVTLFVTPGIAATYRAPQEIAELTVGVHSFRLPFWLWSDQYRLGQRLIVTPFRQVAANNWPTVLKCRSRMHYYLADQAAARVDPRARALLLDQSGRVAETSTANVVGMVSTGRLIAPPDDMALPGISLQVVQELATQLGWVLDRRPIELDELKACREVWLTSTPYCLLPVTAIDDVTIGQGVPGTGFYELIDQWSRRVGIDILAQAQHHGAAAQMGRENSS